MIERDSSGRVTLTFRETSWTCAPCLKNRIGPLLLVCVQQYPKNRIVQGTNTPRANICLTRGSFTPFLHADIDQGVATMKTF